MSLVALWLRLRAKFVAPAPGGTGASSAQHELGHSTVEIFRSSQAHLASIGEGLTRSMNRHVVDNDAVRSAFADLAFELELARDYVDLTPTGLSALLEPTP